MALQCGIVGLPNVGKSTLFNALSNAGALAANYPFATIEPNVGMVPVPDPRLDGLAAIVQPQAILPTVVRIVDIAGLIKGAVNNDGLGKKFLGNIRECDAILHVLRCFDDPNIIHVETAIDPVRDRDIVETELQLQDLETLEKKIVKSRSTAKGGDKDAVKEVALVEALIGHLQQGLSVRSYPADEETQKMIQGFFLLTAKPVLYVCNVDEAGIAQGNKYVDAVRAAIEGEGAEMMIICAAIEEEIQGLTEAQEKADFLTAMGISEPGLDKLIRSAYKLLKLYTYFTAGVKEVRAWTIPQGARAPQAAGVIHTDFEKGFIRAEVIAYADYIQYKGEQGAKEAGKLGVQGKDYVVQDGDVMHFRFNV